MLDTKSKRLLNKIKHRYTVSSKYNYYKKVNCWENDILSFLVHLVIILNYIYKFRGTKPRINDLLHECDNNGRTIFK